MAALPKRILFLVFVSILCFSDNFSTEDIKNQFLVGKTRNVTLISKNNSVSLVRSRLKRFLGALALLEDASSLGL